MWTALTGLVLAVLCFFYFVMRKKLGYWQAKGVVVPPMSPWFGHLSGLLLEKHRWEYIDTLYKQYKDLPYWGMYEFGLPCLFLRDADLIKAVTVKDSDHFIDRRDIPLNIKGSESDATFAEMLLHQKGDKWKSLRALLSPTFTSGKIKAMFNSISDKADELVSFLDKKGEGKSMIEIRKPLGGYTQAVIGISAFGLDIPISDEVTEFETHCEAVISFNIWFIVKLILMSIVPMKVIEFLGLQLAAQSTVDLKNLAEKTIQTRKAQKIRREDFLDLLSDLKENAENSEEAKYPMTMTSVYAQCVLFLIAGFDSTSNSLSFTCFLMGKNQEAQDKLRKELQKIYEADGEFTYQNIMEAHYLEACFAESLRMYGPAHFLERKCTRDYKFEKTGLIIEHGTMVAVPSWSLHYDEDLWEQPRVYQPERFLPENKDRIKPFSYLPFGSGARNCIGMRFAQLEAKLALAKLVLNHRITLPEGHDQIIFNNEVFALRSTEAGVYVKYERIEGEYNNTSSDKA